ncbi:hypothetical protein D3C77_565990 [compost metagenome]
MHIRCKCSDNNTLLCLTKYIVQYNTDIFLRRCKARLLSVGAIRQKSKHSLFTDFTHTMQISKLIIDWSMIKFEVTRMNYVSFRRFDAHPNRIRNTVICFEECRFKCRA